jgi:hypothetical protein
MSKSQKVMLIVTSILIISVFAFDRAHTSSAGNKSSYAKGKNKIENAKDGKAMKDQTITLRDVTDKTDIPADSTADQTNG